MVSGKIIKHKTYNMAQQNYKVDPVFPGLPGSWDPNVNPVLLYSGSGQAWKYKNNVVNTICQKIIIDWFDIFL